MVNKTILYILNPENYFGKVIDIFKNELKGKDVVYATTNKPCGHITTLFKEAGIANKIFFIDCISRSVMGSRTEEEPENCIFIDSPQNITAISIAITKSVENLSGEKNLFVDSLSTMLMYNDANMIGRFSNFFINKMRIAGVDTIILALESDIDKDIIKKIEAFVDEVKKNAS